MTFAEMIKEVQNIITDESFSAEIPGYINEAILQMSGEVKLPDLKVIGVVSTVEDTLCAPLSGIANGFSGSLSKILTKGVTVYDSLESMLTDIQSASRELTENGAVEMVALEGKTLWYFPIPKPTQEITCVLISNPKPLTAGDDIPSYFPEIAHRNVCVHGAAKIFFDFVEDGLEGDKVNTLYHTNMYLQGVQQVREWVGRNRVHNITSVLNDINP